MSQLLERTFPANTTVLCLESHKGERGYECDVRGCRDIWFYGDGDVRWFNGLGTVCATHGYLISIMSRTELREYAKENQDERFTMLCINDNGKINIIPTTLYNSKGKKKEFFVKRQDIETTNWWCPKCQEFNGK